ncbi:MAG TPA: hypothetical protein VGM05_01415 [Planctomycetaceae bacterium]
MPELTQQEAVLVNPEFDWLLLRGERINLPARVSVDGVISGQFMADGIACERVFHIGHQHGSGDFGLWMAESNGCFKRIGRLQIRAGIPADLEFRPASPNDLLFLFAIQHPRFREAVSIGAFEAGREILGFFIAGHWGSNCTFHNAGVAVRATLAVHFKHLFQNIICGLRFAALTRWRDVSGRCGARGDGFVRRVSSAGRCPVRRRRLLAPGPQKRGNRNCQSSEWHARPGGEIEARRLHVNFILSRN